MENHKDNSYPEFAQFISKEELELVMDYHDSIFLSELIKIHQSQKSQQALVD